MEKSPNDEEQKRTLLCKNIPQNLAKRQLLKTHFEQFGVVTKVLVNVERGAASVEFESHAQAASARMLGTSYHTHDISITWKRSSSKSTSIDGSKVDPKSLTTRPGLGVVRSSLFGKALSSVTGRKLMRPEASSSSAHTQPSARNLLKREPAPEGLYDDLPPPADWNEDKVISQQLKSEWRSQILKQPSIAQPSTESSKPTAGASKASKSRTLFGKAVQPKSEPSSSSTVAEKTSLFGKPIQSQHDRTQASTGLVSKPAGIALFGKLVKPEPSASRKTGESASQSEPSTSRSAVRPATFGVPPKEAFTEESSKPKSLFGKPIAAVIVQSEGEADIAHQTETKAIPSLFGKQQERRAISPARWSAIRGLSPAPTGPTWSASPAPTQTTLFGLKKSLSPAPVGIQPQVLEEHDMGEVEWIMPSLMACLRQTPAFSCSERQAILEKREKLIRQSLNKQSDISKAKATKGCCPDMCPERERYIREERRRVHAYEMVPGTESQPQINHSIAIKEYSRSSADQEEPLPLELRPAHVLARTMEYLCNNILDIGADAIWGDWYDFLWNRTRAIRKDITQQHLCSVLSAGLVEKCVRFHIFCGARLVEEGSMSFDTKINNENLTKCLQTLKEMYADLFKRGVACDSEAEFRAYVVLMNLNEGDTLREVQQLRPEVRSSTEIKFALSAYAALNDKNYVKFFKLVQNTTFLNACILHRYFNQIRYEALKIILRAYSAPKGPASVTFDRLISILHFESTDEAATFLGHYGLIVSTANPFMSRESFIEPESPPGVRRAPHLVESKLKTSLGEAVYGQPLPPNIVPEPTSSFDESGHFIGIIKPPRSEQTDNELTDVQATQSSSAVARLPPLGEIPNQIIKDATKQLILVVTNSDTRNIATEAIQEERQYIEYMKDEVDVICHQVVGECVAGLVAEVLEEVKQERHAREKAERRMLIDKMCADYISDLIEKVQDAEVKKVAEETLCDVRTELHEKIQARCADDVGSQLIHQHMVSFLEEVAEEVYQTDVVERIQQLNRAQQLVERIRCRRFYRKWVALYRKRTHLRRTMIAFPAGPPLRPPKRGHGFRVTPDTLTLGKRSRLSVGTPKDMKSAIKHSVIERTINLMVSNTPLNMTNTLTPVLCHGDASESDYMKLTVLLPAQASCEEDRLLSSWLTMKLSSGAVPEERASAQGNLLSLYNITVHGASWGSAGRRFGVCVRSFDPATCHSVGHVDSMRGANMVAYLLPFTTDPDEWYWENSVLQLRRFLSSHAPAPSLPLLIISPLDVTKEMVQSNLQVYDLLETNVLSHVRVDRLDSSIEYTKQLPESVRWLVSSRPHPPDLLITDLKSVLDDFLTNNFHSKIYQDLFDRQSRDLIHQTPGALIDFYNGLISVLADTVFTEEISRKYSWPVYERSHGCIVNLGGCPEMLTPLMLPPFVHSLSDDWGAAYTDVLMYISALVDRHEESSELFSRGFHVASAPALCSRVQNLLAKTESVFTSRSLRRFHSPPNIEPLRYNVPWADIVVACVEFTISAVDSDKKIMHHRHIDEDFLVCGVEYPTGPDCTYADTMAFALEKARKENKAADNSSFIDLDLSLRVEPFTSLKTELSEELNASHCFEELLASELGRDVTFTYPGKVESDGETRHATEKGQIESVSLQELIKSETEKNKQFEAYLLSVLHQVD